MAMNTYYTAKDIEEMAANGTQQLVLGPGVFLTDFARETARYLGIDLVKSEAQSPPTAPPISTNSAPVISDRYNKPSGCQHGASPQSIARSQAVAPVNQALNAVTHNAAQSANSPTVNRLIDLMGKVIKRGG
jgi:hypothetical protein